MKNGLREGRYASPLLVFLNFEGLMLIEILFCKIALCDLNSRFVREIPITKLMVNEKNIASYSYWIEGNML